MEFPLQFTDRGPRSVAVGVLNLLVSLPPVYLPRNRRPLRTVRRTPSLEQEKNKNERTKIVDGAIAQ